MLVGYEPQDIKVFEFWRQNSTLSYNQFWRENSNKFRFPFLTENKSQKEIFLAKIT